MNRPALSLLTTSLLLAFTAPAWSQAGARPGNPLDTLPQQPSRTTGEVQVKPQAPAPAPANQAQTLVPARFDIEGVKSIPFAEVAKVFTPLVGKPITVASLVAIAQQTNNQYLEAGYALSFFFVPQQDFAGGVVRIVAVEGFISKVAITGDAGRSKERIEAIAAHLVNEKPLTRASFDRYTALLGQLPGFNIQAQAPNPTTTDGATTLTLTAKRKPYAATVGGELGQPQSRAVLGGELNDTLTPSGQLNASTLLFPRGQEKYYAGGYVQPFGSNGLVLKASTSLYQADPTTTTIGSAQLERRTGNRRADLSASFPIALSPSRTLVLSGGMYGTNSTDEYRNVATGASLMDDTRVRAAYLQVAGALSQPGVDRSASAMLVQGIDALGAQAALVSNVAGLSGTNPVSLRFTRLLVNAAESRRWGNWGAAASFTGQYSAQALPLSERISFGGTRFARGYGPGEVTGDSGAGFGLEVNRRFAPLANSAFRLEPYALLEFAHSYNRLSHSGTDLTSFTLGARLTDQKMYTVDFALSKPLGDVPLENPERKPRASVLLSYRLGDN